ncbi:hypothetical protein BHF71_09655 [Vulcanibacillus modesticaldus]|uniref:YkoY family integral membrane protein n=1 Tax=Vulcanibacillus modesticaldus TaxID=337097 RepID=A0A1D2YU20_9BACI|nr:TerC family protein [Vulcanibacillus modesticaldus]OEF99204.1 hypothetical protein BHF71_09655 [Vulcanibacillus modesticaldus]
MEVGLILEYGWVLLVLVALEGILAADNALVMAIMVRHLPDKKRKKALFYGLAGAFVFRFISLFVISFLLNIWQVQAVGAIYLIFVSGNYLIKKVIFKKEYDEKLEKEENKGSGFWTTVLKVELADIAFAVDSILAAVALAVTLPATNLPKIGGIDGGQFLVILLGGLIGVVIMRFVASYFVRLLKERPGLEIAVFLIVGWIGIKLGVYTLSHPELGIIYDGFPKLLAWKLIFWIVLILISLGGWLLSGNRKESINS